MRNPLWASGRQEPCGRLWVLSMPIQYSSWLPHIHSETKAWALGWALGVICSVFEIDWMSRFENDYVGPAREGAERNECIWNLEGR